MGFRVGGIGFRVWGLEFRVQDSGFRVSGLGKNSHANLGSAMKERESRSDFEETIPCAV